MDLAEFLEKYFGRDTACGDAGPKFSVQEKVYLATYGFEAVDEAFGEILCRIRAGLVVFPVGEENMPWSEDRVGGSIGVLVKMVGNMSPMLVELVPTHRGIVLKFVPKES